jgi:hypothetical protein
MAKMRAESESEREERDSTASVRKKSTFPGFELGIYAMRVTLSRSVGISV